MKGRKPAALVSGPSPVNEILPPPAWLSRDSKAEWRRIMPDLTERRVLTVADLGCVENYCVAVGRVREIERLLRKSGDLDPRLFRMQNQAITVARQIASEVGLTPVSRSRPSVREDDEDSLLDL